jgi:hypothetical protein
MISREPVGDSTGSHQPHEENMKPSSRPNDIFVDVIAWLICTIIGVAAGSACCSILSVKSPEIKSACEAENPAGHPYHRDVPQGSSSGIILGVPGESTVTHVNGQMYQDGMPSTVPLAPSVTPQDCATHAGTNTEITTYYRITTPPEYHYIITPASLTSTSINSDTRINEWGNGWISAEANPIIRHPNDNDAGVFDPGTCVNDCFPHYAPPAKELPLCDGIVPQGGCRIYSEPNGYLYRVDPVAKTDDPSLPAAKEPALEDIPHSFGWEATYESADRLADELKEMLQHRKTQQRSNE